jgi:hypothetical protein
MERMVKAGNVAEIRFYSELRGKTIPHGNELAQRPVASTITAPFYTQQWNNLSLDNAGSAIASLNSDSVSS